MKEINYRNKANQTIHVQYEYKDFGSWKIMKGLKTLIGGHINNTRLPPFYINGYVCEKEVKRAVSAIRANRKYLKKA